MRTEGKAELIGGRIVRWPPAGWWPGTLAGRVAISLHDYAEATGRGEAYTSLLAYGVPELPSGRESFSPDASYYTGPHPDNPMSYMPGPPDLAVEVRSAEEYTPAAEREMAAKRADYFQAGTLVVWDVDPVAEVVRKYTAAAPDVPTVFARGEEADAEPAVPGWRLSVDWLMR
jgi:Uma2 family endonuclease